MQLEWDEVKREATLVLRGLDFADANLVFNSTELELVDDRKNYGELRMVTFGFIDHRPVAMVWTPRGKNRRIISMRHVHDDEIEARRRALD